MKKSKRLPALLLALLLGTLTSCGSAAGSSVPPQSVSSQESAASTPEPMAPGPQLAPEQRASELLATLTTEQKVGQLFVANINGTTMDDETRAFLERTRIGNIILFGSNAEQAAGVPALCTQLQDTIVASTGAAAFIGIDQEGGAITRIRSGATWFPGAMAMSAANADTSIAGRYMGEELRALGVNFNFAPSADVNSNPDNPVIGARSYGDTPERVATFATAMAQGLQQGGVLACVKHFPGHGDTSTDSHYGLPMIDKSVSELTALELVPFQTAIAGGVDAVMSAHIMFPQVDATYPATMSHAMLTGVLREQLGFQGLIITDSLKMGAIVDYFGMDNACVQAVLAGADLLLTGTNNGDLAAQEQAYNAVLAAVKSGKITAERLDESVLRILTAKARYNILDNPYPAADALTQDWSEHFAFAEQAARDSITLTHDQRGLLPLKKEDRVLFVSVTATMALTDDITNPQLRENSVARLLADAYGVTDWIALSDHVDYENGQTAQLATGYDKVVLMVRNAAASEDQGGLVRSIAAANPNLVLISASPYDSFVFGGAAGAFLCTYEYTPPAARAVVSVLTQGSTPKGVMPVS